MQVSGPGCIWVQLDPLPNTGMEEDLRGCPEQKHCLGVGGGHSCWVLGLSEFLAPSSPAALHMLFPLLEFSLSTCQGGRAWAGCCVSLGVPNCFQTRGPSCSLCSRILQECWLVHQVGEEGNRVLGGQGSPPCPDDGSDCHSVSRPTPVNFSGPHTVISMKTHIQGSGAHSKCAQEPLP